MLLWLQKPVRPALLMARWLLEVELLSVLLAALVTAATAAAVGATGGDVRMVLLSAPGLVVMAAVAGAVGFAFSATTFRPDGLVTVLWIALLSPLLSLGSMDEATGLGQGLAELVAFPWDHAAALVRAGPQGSAALVPPLEAMAGHLAFWVVLGMVLAVARCRSPVPSAARH